MDLNKLTLKSQEALRLPRNWRGAGTTSSSSRLTCCPRSWPTRKGWCSRCSRSSGSSLGSFATGPKRSSTGSPRSTARRRTCTSPRRRVTSWRGRSPRSEEHTSELQSRPHLVCRLLLEKKKEKKSKHLNTPKKNKRK